jgi:hypothetical protein
MHRQFAGESPGRPHIDVGHGEIGPVFLDIVLDVPIFHAWKGKFRSVTCRAELAVSTEIQ